MRLTIEPLDVERDLGLLHRWVTHPRSVFWEMQDASAADVAAEYARMAEDPHHHAFLGRADGEPAFVVERYDPAHSPLAGLPELRDGDVGMHVLVAPPGRPRPGFTTEVFQAVMESCFADPAVRRVVVEPDVRNARIRALNVAAGFAELREITLDDKVGMLSVCTREDFERARSRVTAHLTPELMARAQRRLVAKAIAEYAHERLVEPVSTSSTNEPTSSTTERTGSGYELVGPRSTYTFTAHVHALEHWVLDLPSLARTVDGKPAELDAQELVAEFAPALGIPDQLLPTYLEEIASTLASAAWKLRHSTASAHELASADHQTVEGAMTEGHPAFVANNGRIGFGADDYAAYAPEAGRDVRLVWLAARRSVARLSLGADLVEHHLYRDELGGETLARFARELGRLGLAPEDYVYLPVHPWQWVNKLAVTFAPDLAQRDLVHLGEGTDTHRPQQSIRTFFNTSRPERHYVKTALSIQNMGFMRGLSPAYMEATPAINDWVADTVASDDELHASGFTVLRELAAVGYTGDAFHRLAGSRRPELVEGSPYRKMVAALWRESPVPKLADGERAATMAALLHRDAQGDALVTALVKSSPLDAAEWVRTYLRAYLRPLVHCLFAYDLVFMPHGENLVMVLQDQVPVRMVLKDIGEEVAVMGNLPLPAGIERIRVDVPADLKALAIHTDVFDGFLRHLAAILDQDGVLAGDAFWALVAGVLHEHAADHPEMAEAAGEYDLFQPEFRHSCLNRLQLRNTLEMVDLTDQAESLIFAGTLANPIAPYAEPGRRTDE
jgi:siderophore synthetase component